jgi:hypothetical protein
MMLASMAAREQARPFQGAKVLKSAQRNKGKRK